MLPTIRFFFIMLLFTLLAGFFIVPTRDMPDNAVVLLDDQTQTYFSPACADQEKRDISSGHGGRGAEIELCPG